MSSSSTSSSPNFNEVQLPSDWQNVGPLFPRCCLRDGSVDITGLSGLLYSVRRSAWRRGWNPPTQQNKRNEGNNKDDVEQNRVFMASNLICLANVGVYDKTKETDLDIHGGGRAAISHAGTTSYQMYSEVEAVGPDDETGNAKIFIGFQLIALVSIDGKTRRPMKLSDEKREALQKAVAEGHAPAKVQSLGATPLGRLPTHNQIMKSSSSSSSTTCYEMTLSIRPYTDFDFNQHVNQGQYIAWLKDTLTAMTASEQRFGGEENVSYSYLSSTLRVARMDYVEETRVREGTVTVRIFCGDDVDRHATDAIGSGLLHKLKNVPKSNENVPKNNLSSGVRAGDMTDLRTAYYTIVDNSTGRVSNRGFVAFDAKPSTLVDRKKAAAESKTKSVGGGACGSGSLVKKLLTASAIGAAGAAIGAWLVKSSKL